MRSLTRHLRSVKRSLEIFVIYLERSFVIGERCISSVEGGARSLDRNVQIIGRSNSIVLRSQDVWRYVQVICR